MSPSKPPRPYRVPKWEFLILVGIIFILLDEKHFLVNVAKTDASTFVRKTIEVTTKRLIFNNTVYLNT